MMEGLHYGTFLHQPYQPKSSLPGYPRGGTFKKNRMIKRKLENNAKNIPYLQGEPCS
jgi:hypothetical protein